MQKKLLTIAVAAALAAPVAAIADVTVYGQMHFSYDWVDGAGDSEGNTGVSRASRIGFKGAEDLGGGLKGVWQIEAEVEMEGSSDDSGFDLRNTFVGLAGDFGTILAGRHDTPYKLSTGKLDFFTDRAADYNNLIGTIDGVTIVDERAPQTIAYVTPNWSGFSAAVAYVDHYFTSPDDESDTAWSLMAMYDNAGFFATVAYEHQEGNNLIGVTGGGFLSDLKSAATALAPAGSTGAAAAIEEPEVDAWKVGLGYTFGGTTIGGIYEHIEAQSGDASLTWNAGAGGVPAAGGVVVDPDDDLERDAYYLTAQHVFGNNVIKGYYGWADELDADESIEDTGAQIWAVGYDYNFSKRTTLYALYTQVGNDDNASYGANSGQAVSSGYVRDAEDEDVNVFSVGVIHKF